MRLSVVFELILVFLFLAFAAARVIEKKNGISSTQNSKKLRQGPPNRYCSCTTNMCNCCRDFSLPVVPLKGPGCASIMYLKGDNMMITMSFGERILSNTTIVGPKPKPVCMTLPGGISQFCGRVYGISRTEKNFKACLGLELRALDDIEAALRISCFKFGPKGVSLESAPPLPENENKEPDEEDEDEDDYDLDDEEEDDDIIGFGGDLDDDEDDEDDDEITNNVSDGEGNDVETDSADYAGFSVLGEDFFGSLFNDDDTRPVKKKKKPIQKVINPVIQLSSTTKLPEFSVKRSTPRTEKNTKTPVNKVIYSSNSSNTKITVEGPITTVKSTVIPTESAKYVQNSSVSTTTENALANQTKNYFLTEHTSVLPSKQFTLGTTALPERITQAINVTFGEKHHTESYYSYETVIVPTNEVKLPDLDVEKIEAVVAIAQQGVTPSVLTASSLSASDVDKLSKTHETLADKVIVENGSAETTAPFLKVGYTATEFEIKEKGNNDCENDEKKRKNELMNEDALDATRSQLNKIIGNENDKNKDNIEIVESNTVKSYEEESEKNNDDYFGEMGSKDDKETEDEEDYDRKSDEKDENVGEEETKDKDDVFGQFINNDEANSVKKDIMILTNNSKEFEWGERIEQDDFLGILDDDELGKKLANTNNNENQVSMTNMVKIEQPLMESVLEDLRKDEVNKKILLPEEKISFYDNSSSDEVEGENLNRMNSPGKDEYLDFGKNRSSIEIRFADKSNIEHDKVESFVEKYSFPSSETKTFPKGSLNKKGINSQETKTSGVYGSRRNYQYLPSKFSNINSRTHRRMNLDKLDVLKFDN